MAIVQISRITQRKGLQEDLPQLAGAEFGWSVDERRLFIGNGTLEEGAPVIGNTEILTEFSDILAVSQLYTYKGAAAGYTAQTGPTPGTPVTQSLQSWLDQQANIKDFGAVGDGITDDTAAINRALYQIYCRETNPQIRRRIFFPAGVYLVTDTIIIPPYATLFGEGPDNSVIKLSGTITDSTLTQYVARTGDSLQQVGANIGINGAITPYSVSINNLGFSSDADFADIFLVEDINECLFTNVDFHGPLNTSNLTSDADDIACVRFSSTVGLISRQIAFQNCTFANATYAMNTDNQVRSVDISGCHFDTLYQGILLGTGVVVSGGPTGFSITDCDFDNIYAEGIIFGDVSLNATAQNIFYDVGNHFGGTTQPFTAVIDIQSANNVSVGDMFERSADYALVFPRIRLNDTTSIAFTNGEQIAMGSFVRETGQAENLVDNQVSPSTIFTVNADLVRAFLIEYTIVRGTGYRTGTVLVATDSGSSDLNYTEEYTENLDIGVTLTLTQTTNTVSVKYTSTSTSTNPRITYSITHLA